MSQTVAARLMKPHHERISRAVARQIRRMVPRYQQVDEVALERNLKTVLGGIQRLLERGDPATVSRVIGDVAQLRNTTGFQVSELLLAAMCFQPVVRRFLVTHAPSVSEGLAAYEAVEAITLPLFGQLVESYLEADDADDDEDTAPFGIRLPTGADGFLKPLAIEEVLDEEDAIPPPVR